MWFKQDRSFFVPTVNINIRLETNKGFENLFQSTSLYFFEALLAEWIKDHLYDALQISYGFSFQATTNGLQFSISGYNDKITELSERLFISFRNLEMTQTSFDRVKSKFISDLKEEKMKQPYTLAFLFTKVLYQEHGHTFDEILEAATNLTLDSVADFHEELFEKAYTKSLVHGNMASGQAAELKSMIDKHLDFGILEDPAKVKPKTKMLDGPYAYTYHAFNKDEQDSAIFNSYQISYLKRDDPNDIKDLLCLEVITSLISTFAYDYLRTDKLLGYIVSSGSFAIGRTGYLYIIVQGNKESPEVMDNEIEIMLKNFGTEELSKISEKRFNTVKGSIKEQLTAPDDSLSERTNRIWRQIIDRDNDFHLREKMVKQLESLTLAELVALYNKKLIPEEKSAVKKLSVQFYSPKAYPVLPKSLQVSTTPYKGLNVMNSELVFAQF